jgi:glutamate/aspartate transport system permease protein
MLGSFDFGAIWRSLPYLLFDGLRLTLTLTVLAAAGGVVLGTVLALLRLSRVRILSTLVAGYVNLMRSLPLLLVIFWFYFLVPHVAQWVTGAPRPVPVGGFVSALLTFTLFETAYFSEIIRAGLQSIPAGQAEAGVALGLKRSQVMRLVILPQVFRATLPILLTQTIILFQDTSLVYVLSLTDFLGAASKIAQRDGRLVELYVFCALGYMAISLAASRAVALLRARMTAVT